MQRRSFRVTPPLIGAGAPARVLRRVLENASILAFASLLVMSVALGRYTGALVWTGALLVFLVHAWESRTPPRPADESAAMAAQLARRRRFDALRGLGIVLALVGVVALTV